MNVEANKLCGKALSGLRRDAGLTQSELAIRMKVPQSFVSKVETGERSLKVYEQFSYAEAVGIDIQSFVAEIERALKDGLLPRA